MKRNLIIIEGSSFLQIKHSKFIAFAVKVNSHDEFIKQLNLKKKENKNEEMKLNNLNMQNLKLRDQKEEMTDMSGNYRKFLESSGV